MAKNDINPDEEVGLKSEIAEEEEEDITQQLSKQDTLSLLQDIKRILRDQNDRLDDLEHGKKGNGRDNAVSAMIPYIYAPDAEHLPEMSRIPLGATDMLALGMMLDHILDDEVQSGKVSLNSIYRGNLFKLWRAQGGRLLNLAQRIAEAQVQNESEEAAQEVEL